MLVAPLQPILCLHPAEVALLLLLLLLFYCCATAHLLLPVFMHAG
jgi:hypothetical protein